MTSWLIVSARGIPCDPVNAEFRQADLLGKVEAIEVHREEVDDGREEHPFPEVEKLPRTLWVNHETMAGTGDEEVGQDQRQRGRNHHPDYDRPHIAEHESCSNLRGDRYPCERYFEHPQPTDLEPLVEHCAGRRSEAGKDEEEARYRKDDRQFRMAEEVRKRSGEGKTQRRKHEVPRCVQRPRRIVELRLVPPRIADDVLSYAEVRHELHAYTDGDHEGHQAEHGRLEEPRQDDVVQEAQELHSSKGEGDPAEPHEHGLWHAQDHVP